MSGADQLRPAILPFDNGDKSIAQYIVQIQPTMLGQIQALGTANYQKHVVLGYKVSADGMLERVVIPFSASKRFFIFKGGPESFVATVFGIFSNFILTTAKTDYNDIQFGVSITASYRNPVSVTNTASTGLGAYIFAQWNIGDVQFTIPILTLVRDENALDQILASESEETLKTRITSLINTFQTLIKEKANELKGNKDFEVATNKLANLDSVARLRAVMSLYRQTKTLRQGPPDSVQVLLDRLVSSKNTSVVLDVD